MTKQRLMKARRRGAVVNADGMEVGLFTHGPWYLMRLGGTFAALVEMITALWDVIEMNIYDGQNLKVIKEGKKDFKALHHPTSVLLISILNIALVLSLSI